MTITKVLAGLALSTALIGSASAADLNIGSGTYQLDPTHGSLFWSVNHFGLSEYTARINSFDATIELDADDITQSSMTATIDMASVDTDFPNPDAHDFNAELRGEKLAEHRRLPAGDLCIDSDHPDRRQHRRDRRRVDIPRRDAARHPRHDADRHHGQAPVR